MTDVSPHLYSGAVWKQLSTELHRTRRAPAHVAIAYLGSNADDLLAGLRPGDLLVCDASDRAIRNGSTDVQQLQRLLARGIHLYTHEGMHSKCAQVGSRVLVGSANASRLSAQHRAEAVLALTSKSVATQVRNHVLDLTAHPGRRLSEIELDLLAQLPVKPLRLPRQSRSGSVVPFGARIWLMEWDWDPEDWTPEESDEFDLEDRAARSELDKADYVEVWHCPHDLAVAQGDYLCFVNPDETEVCPPSQILAVRPATKETRFGVYYVVRGDLDTVSTHDARGVLKSVWPETLSYDPILVPASLVEALNTLPWSRQESPRSGRR